MVGSVYLVLFLKESKSKRFSFFFNPFEWDKALVLIFSIDKLALFRKCSGQKGIFLLQTYAFFLLLNYSVFFSYFRF